MEKDRKILTIAIPTYNRSVQIQKQIRMILPQLTDEVNLVVYDNCSEIPVCTLFNEDELRLFTIIRNSVNIGGDANIARCHELCDTEWLWVLGDDDFICNNAVNVILTNIKQYPDVVWLNFATKETALIDSAVSFFGSINSIQDFSDSFWISKCVYNNARLKPYLFYYYVNLSSMIGQIIFVIKYALNTPDFSCLKSEQNIFAELTPGGWNINLFANRLGIVYEAFSFIEKKQLKHTFWDEVAEARLRMITNDRDAFKLWLKVLIDYGLWLSVRRFPFLVMKKFIVVSLPHFAYSWLKSFGNSVSKKLF